MKVIIVSFDYDRTKAEFFRTYSTNAGAHASTARLADAVHASSNAPVSFFDAPAQIGAFRYWDGAMGGHNNPVLVAIVEALVDGVQPKEIVALSLGAGTVKLAPLGGSVVPPAGLAAERDKPGIFSDAGKAGSTINDDPPDAASFMTHVVMGNPVTASADSAASGRLVRLSPVVRPVLTAKLGWQLPTGLIQKQFDCLKNLSMAAVEQNDVHQIAAVGVAWMRDTVPNQPIRMRSDDLSSAIGDDTYSSGRNRWLAHVRK